MLSKGLAAMKGIFASLPATLCYLADTGSTFRLMFQARRRRGRWHSGGGPAPKNLGQKRAPRAVPKKSRGGGEPVNQPRVERVAPGEAPQPLTLNHPALSPGCDKQPGLPLSGSAWSAAEPMEP